MALNIIREFLSPPIYRQFRALLGRGSHDIKFEGPFPSWDSALLSSLGYHQAEILEKVLAATLKVKKGVAAYERDSVVFQEVQYSWPVTAALMWAAARDGGRLSVLDFGGSLGSSYFQNREFLKSLEQVNWMVVEQPHFVKEGQKFIQDENLRFFESTEECLSYDKPNLVLLSSVLQYLAEPYKVFSELLNLSCSLVVIDRSPFIKDDTAADKIYVQSTPASIYSVSYPIWFFNKSSFLSRALSYGYTELSEFQAVDRLHNDATWKGVILVRRDSF